MDNGKNNKNLWTKKSNQEQQYHPPQQVSKELELPRKQVKEVNVENTEEGNNVPQVENTTNQLR